MKTRRPFYFTFVFCLFGLIGCRSEAPPSQHPETTPFVRRDATGHAVTTTQPSDTGASLSDQPPVPDTASVIAERAANYAHSIAPLRAKHAGDTAVAPTEWPDPQALHLTPQPETDQGPAASKDEAEASPKMTGAQANASVAVATVQHHLVAPDPSPSTPSPEPASGEPIGTQLAQRAKDYPSDLSAQVDNQLFKLLKDDTVADVSSTAGLIPEDRELLSALMDSLTNFRSQLRADNNMLFSKKIRPLLEMSDRLKSQAELSVPTVALCTGVKAFGVYDPIDPARFVAGREQRVVVYCEVENFLSQPNEKNLYETRLSQEIVLYEESSGLPVWTDKKSTYVDLARRRRHDFFMGKIITLPATLTINRYLLKVTVEDEEARHIAENTVPVEIVAQ